MASNIENEHGPASMVDLCEQAVECCLCKELKPLRELPCCPKRCCDDCIDKHIFKQSDVKCLYCFSPLTMDLEAYPICKDVQNMQNFLLALKDNLLKDAEQTCSSPDCGRGIEMRCKVCKQFFCVRCRKLPCQDYTDHHDCIDISECVTDSKERIIEWKSLKQKEIDSLKFKITKATDSIRSCGKRMTEENIPDEELCDVVRTVTPLISKSESELRKLLDGLSHTDSYLHLVDYFEKKGLMSREMELVRFVDQLQLCDDTRNITLSDFEAIITGVKCYDVSWCSKTQDILIAKDGGVDAFAIRSETTTTIMAFEDQYAFVVEPYKEFIFVAIQNNDLSARSLGLGEIITLDTSYAIIRRWKAPRYACDLAAVDEKIFVSVGSNVTPNDIKVYSLVGEPLSDILWNGEVACISAIPPSSIIFGDSKQHKLYKQQVTDGGRCISWSAEVKVPRCSCTDESGNVWIRSNVNDCIVILFREGNPRNPIVDEKLTKLVEITDLCVYNDFLYVTHSSGMGRFSLVYQQD